MKIELRSKYLSRPRYNRYLTATGNNSSRAKRLYAANIRLAQAFHPLLSQFEVVLRNSLNIILSSNFTDPDWIISQKTGFMKDNSLRSSHYFLRTCVQKTERKLTRRGIPITTRGFIAQYPGLNIVGKLFYTYLLAKNVKPYRTNVKKISFLEFYKSKAEILMHIRV